MDWIYGLDNIHSRNSADGRARADDHLPKKLPRLHRNRASFHRVELAKSIRSGYGLQPRKKCRLQASLLRAHQGVEALESWGRGISLTQALRRSWIWKGR